MDKENMMKKLVMLTALLAIAAWPMMAQTSAPSVGFDNYHYRQNMNCSDCHSMHASAHNNLTDGAAITTPLPAGSMGVNPYYPAPNPGAGRASLLKTDDVCETCHKDQTFAPDVYGDNMNGYTRSAGGIREDAVGGGHRIGSAIRPPGYDATNANNYFASGDLECVSCHSPHGGTGFRNLQGNSMRTALGANAGMAKPLFTKDTTFSATNDVNININGASRTWGTDSMAAYYGRDKVTYTKLATPVTMNSVNTSNRMDHFCGVCHGNFHGGEVSSPVGNGTGFVRHPTSTVIIADAGHGDNPVGKRWNSGPGTIAGRVLVGQKTLGNVKVYTADGTSDATSSSPGCVSCHKAHGNSNPFALIYPSRTAVDTTEEGGGAYRDLCQSCHPMGGY
jgi:hypothetical protein